VDTEEAEAGRLAEDQAKTRKRASQASRLGDLRRELAAKADPARAQMLARYFRSEAGGYGEGDQFLGLRVPVLQKIGRGYTHLSLSNLERLLASGFHEERLAALMILVLQYRKADRDLRKTIVTFYLGHTKAINNWDLVDSSAREILGEHLLKRSRQPLVKLAKSRNLWERRIAIVATQAFVRAGELETCFLVAKLLLGDTHDLIHKAVGWTLREAGKKSMPQLLAFLEENYALLPRTTLRYAIERLPRARRSLILLRRFH
jgi:3-methyladenine DNA glycosylase AlkD